MERKWVFLQFIHRIIVINSLLVTLVTFLAFMARVELFRKSEQFVCTTAALYSTERNGLAKTCPNKKCFPTFSVYNKPPNKAQVI